MMLRRACPLLIGLLAVEVVRTRRRLANAETELGETRAAALGGPVVARSLVPEPEPREETGVTTRDHGPESATAVQDLSTEWEQAVPPMDS